MKSRGYTLIEILVAAFVLLIIFTVMGSLLYPGLRTWMQIQHRSALEQDGTLGVLDVTHEVSESIIRNVVITPVFQFDPLQNTNTEIDTVSFMSYWDQNEAVSFSDIGITYLRKFVRFSVDSNWNLNRWDGFLPPGYTNAQLLSLHYPDIMAGSSLLVPQVDLRVVARNVHRFQCTLATQQGRLTNPMHLILLTEDPLYEHVFETSVSSAVTN